MAQLTLYVKYYNYYMASYTNEEEEYYDLCSGISSVI